MRWIRLLLCLPLAALTPLATAAHAGTPATAAEAFGVPGWQGKVVVVNFWATWCAPCRAEMPALDAYYQAHRAQGLAMLAVSMDDPSKGAAVKAASAPFHFDVRMARDIRLPGKYRPSQLPVTLIFARDGSLRYDSRKSPELMTQALLSRLTGPLLAETGQ